ncbi:MAG TPA: M28 family peptidase [Gemmataceae bacterium]
MRKLIYVLAVAVLSAAAAAAANREATVARLKKDVYYLASEECEGRGVETEGIYKAADYIVENFRAAGLKPGGVEGTWFQPFTIPGLPRLGAPNSLVLRGPLGQEITLEQGKHFEVCGISGTGEAAAGAVFVGYGISSKDPAYDDYEGVDVRGKFVVVLRRVPRAGSTTAPFVPPDRDNFSPLNYKVANAERHGAAGVIFVNDGSYARGGDGLMTYAYARGAGSSRLPVFHVRRAVLDRMLQASHAVSLGEVETAIDRDLKPRSLELTGWQVAARATVESDAIAARNIIGVLEGSGRLKDETVIIGGHYDHLGRGERGSLARGADQKRIHYGADDNASGTSAVLELARRFAAVENRQGRRLVFILFSGEERGLLGSKHYVEHPLFPLEVTVAMINLDMVGRLNGEKLEVGGTGTAKGFDALIEKLNGYYKFDLKKSPGGMGPSDHAAFYPKKIPVFFFFTGLHENYHRPSDTPDRINYDGMARIVDMVEELGARLATANPRPQYVKVSGGLMPGRQRPKVPSIRFMPGEYDESAEDGLPVAGVTPGGPADRAGLREGDIIVAVSDKPVKNIGGYMAAMAGEQPGRPVKITVLRDGARLELSVVPE